MFIIVILQATAVLKEESNDRHFLYNFFHNVDWFCFIKLEHLPVVL